MASHGRDGGSVAAEDNADDLGEEAQLGGGQVGLGGTVERGIPGEALVIGCGYTIMLQSLALSNYPVNFSLNVSGTLKSAISINVNILGLDCD